MSRLTGMCERVLAVLTVVLLLSAWADGAKASVDVTKGTPFKHTWKECIGSGHMLLGTRADWQGHLRKVSTECGFRRIRGHGMFDDDMSVAPPGQGYQFYNVDIVLDFLRSIGMDLIVELSFMPNSLAKCGDHCSFAFGGPGSYKGIVMPPANFEDWYDLVVAFTKHVVDRYGIDVVKGWSFEVWNEMWGMPYPSKYLPLYNASARAVKSVSKDIPIGGPATEQLQHVSDFIEDTKRLGLPVDFISTHSYPSDPTCKGNEDRDCFAKLVLNAKAIADAAGKPFYLSEYNDGLLHGEHRDIAYASAFVFRNVRLLSSLDLFSWWTFSDVFEEHWMVGPPFEGNFGLLTKQGVAKPVYRAFQLLNTAGTTSYAATADDDAVTVLATDGDSVGVQLFIANFDSICHGNWTPTARSVTVTVNRAFTTGRVTLFDSQHTNPQGLWKSWGSPPYLNATQIDLLHEESTMKPAPLHLDVSGSTTFTIPMEANSAAYVTLA